MKPFSIVVAFDSRYGIGKQGGLPWHLPSDLRHFKEITTHTAHPSRKNAVIMGRKTWESIPDKYRPLPSRLNVVLTTQGNLQLPAGVCCFSSLDDALKSKDLADAGDIFVIGGAQIYAQALKHPMCQKLHVTHVEGEFGCDAFFPAINPQFFPISACEPICENGISFHFSDYLKYA